MAEAIYISEDNLIELAGARLASTGAAITSGTISWALKPADELSTLASGTLTYSSSTGLWTGTIASTDTALTDGTEYVLILTISDGAGADGRRRIELVAKHHGTS